MISFGNHIKYIENVKSKIVGYLWFGNTLDIIRSGYIYIYIYYVELYTVMLQDRSCYGNVAVVDCYLQSLVVYLRYCTQQHLMSKLATDLEKALLFFSLFSLQ